MTVLLHIVQGIFALMMIGLFLGYSASKHIGLLLAGIAFGGSAFASFQLMAWWPLAVGFISAWVLRLIGLDPGDGNGRGR